MFSRLAVLEGIALIITFIYALFWHEFEVFLGAVAVYLLWCMYISLDEAVGVWKEIKEKME